MTKEQLQEENSQLRSEVARLESITARLLPLLESSIKWATGESSDTELANAIRSAMETQ